MLVKNKACFYRWENIGILTTAPYALASKEMRLFVIPRPVLKASILPSRIAGSVKSLHEERRPIHAALSMIAVRKKLMPLL